jgi:hypothetical protein
MASKGDSVVVKTEFEAHISKNGLVKVEFARALNENEKGILKIRGFRWSRSTRTWTYQSNSFYWALKTCWSLLVIPRGHRCNPVSAMTRRAARVKRGQVERWAY